MCRIAYKETQFLLYKLTSEDDMLLLCSSITEFLQHELINPSSVENHTSIPASSLQTYIMQANCATCVICV